MNLQLDTLLSRLDKVQGRDGKFKARCPAHDDRGPSLSVTETDHGQLLIYCFAGCGAADVVEAVGLTMSDLFPPDEYINSVRGSSRKRVNYRAIVENARHAAILVHVVAAKLLNEGELALSDDERVIFEGASEDLRRLIDA